jgi:hypothetical protein
MPIPNPAEMAASCGIVAQETRSPRRRDLDFARPVVQAPNKPVRLQGLRERHNFMRDKILGTIGQAR